MDKFWEWMEDKGKTWHDEFKYYLFVDDGGIIARYCIPTKQMLIGYMIEYLYCYKNCDDIYSGITDLEIQYLDGKCSIIDIYNNLEKAIQEQHQ